MSTDPDGAESHELSDYDLAVLEALLDDVMLDQIEGLDTAPLRRWVAAERERRREREA
jgi:hypothetical protein